MHHLNTKDWHAVSNAVLACNAMTDRRPFIQEALRQIYALIPCKQAFFFSLDKQRDPEGIADYLDSYESIGTTPRFLDLFKSGGYFSEDWFSGMTMETQTSVYRESDVLPLDQLNQYRFYRDIASKEGIFYTLRAFLAPHGKCLACITLHRGLDDGDFSERDLQVLTEFAPHLAQRYSMILDGMAPEDAGATQSRAELGLTQREQQVAKLLLKGLSDREISDALYISELTVKKHIANMHKKVRTGTRAQLIVALGE